MRASPYVCTCVSTSVRACVRACSRACVRACRRAGGRADVHVCQCGSRNGPHTHQVSGTRTTQKRHNSITVCLQWQLGATEGQSRTGLLIGFINTARHPQAPQGARRCPVLVGRVQPAMLFFTAVKSWREHGRPPKHPLFMRGRVGGSSSSASWGRQSVRDCDTWCRVG